MKVKAWKLNQRASALNWNELGIFIFFTGFAGDRIEGDGNGKSISNCSSTDITEKGRYNLSIFVSANGFEIISLVKALLK